MFNKKTIKDIDVVGKKVLVRVDFNVPLKDTTVTDDTRIRAALPTIQHLIDQGAAVILCSHLGRPKAGPEAKFSLKPVADHLASLVDFPVHFAEDCIGEVAIQAAHAIKPGEALLLENTRFHPEEEKNDLEMARQMASLAEVYVNDAFGSAHRAHASTEGVTRYLPGVAGFLLEKEIQYLGQAIENPKRPFIAILGGAKIGDKIGVIKNLLKKAETILIGGGMANTFFAAQGYPMGNSLVDQDSIAVAKELLEGASGRLRLPVDVVIAQKIEPGVATRTMDMGPVPDGWSILDIGPNSVDGYTKVIATAGTIVWNGPMGVFEVPEFAGGTLGIAKAVAASQAVSVIGGGESVAAIQQSGLADKITHISTGGGASLEMLEGLVLPGVAALQDR